MTYKETIYLAAGLSVTVTRVSEEEKDKAIASMSNDSMKNFIISGNDNSKVQLIPMHNILIIEFEEET